MRTTCLVQRGSSVSAGWQQNWNLPKLWNSSIVKRCRKHASKQRLQVIMCQNQQHHRRHICTLQLPLSTAPNFMARLLCTSPKSPVGITIDKSIQQKIQTSAVITVTGRRRSQRSSQKKVAVEKAAATAAEAEQRQSRMFAQYRERQAGEEARLNAQHIGMLRYLKLCY